MDLLDINRKGLSHSDQFFSSYTSPNQSNFTNKLLAVKSCGGLLCNHRSQKASTEYSDHGLHSRDAQAALPPISHKQHSLVAKELLGGTVVAAVRIDLQPDQRARASNENRRVFIYPFGPFVETGAKMLVRASHPRKTSKYIKHIIKPSASDEVTVVK